MKIVEKCAEQRYWENLIMASAVIGIGMVFAYYIHVWVWGLGTKI